MKELGQVKDWVERYFGNIPTRVIERAYGGFREELELLAGGDRLCDHCHGRLERVEPCGECEECKAGIACRDTPMTTLGQESDDYESEAAEFVCEGCDRATIAEWSWAGSTEWPAAWGFMFRPEAHNLADWIQANSAAIADLGFVVYVEPDLGVALGIDATGADFYEAFWTPLWELWEEKAE